MNEQDLENEIIEKGLTAPRLTPEAIDAVIAKEEFYVFENSCLTICCLTLANGFTVSGESACASPENFDAEIGRKIAKENARNKIWMLEGYLLKQRLATGEGVNCLKAAIDTPVHNNKTGLPKWRSIKTVYGAKIEDMLISPGGGACTLSFEGDVRVITVSMAYINKHTPKIGGYYVLYENGYESWSPADAFEAGNVPFELHVDMIARVSHEINAAYCRAIGDYSQVSWDEAPLWQQDSARNGVLFHLDNPDASLSASHDSWYAEKEADGWIYGDVKDPDLKEHPCMLAYEELPAEQRAKDYLFKQTVQSLM